MSFDLSTWSEINQFVTTVFDHLLRGRTILAQGAYSDSKASIYEFDLTLEVLNFVFPFTKQILKIHAPWSHGFPATC